MHRPDNQKCTGLEAHATIAILPWSSLGRIRTGPVAGATDIHHGRGMEQAVHDGAGHHGVGEDLVPVTEAGGWR